MRQSCWTASALRQDGTVLIWVVVLAGLPTSLACESGPQERWSVLTQTRSFSISPTSDLWRVTYIAPACHREALISFTRALWPAPPVNQRRLLRRRSGWC